MEQENGPAVFVGVRIEYPNDGPTRLVRVSPGGPLGGKGWALVRKGGAS